jgi:probable rRNA maturation factor
LIVSAEPTNDEAKGDVESPYLSVEISRAGGDWDAVAEEIVLRLAQAAFEQDGTSSAAELSVLLADDAFVQSLNRKFRGKDKPTNVLSFPNASTPAGALYDEPSSLGDIALAYETVKAEAKTQCKSFDDHLAHLVVHGVLHLLGYDHMDDKDAEKLEIRERELLRLFGIADPYTVGADERSQVENQ